MALYARKYDVSEKINQNSTKRTNSYLRNNSDAPNCLLWPDARKFSCAKISTFTVFHLFLFRSNQYFSIDTSTGTLYTVTPLDRERAASYQLTVVAQDNGYPHLNAMVGVEVIVTDVNDHAPRFERQSYEVTIAEKAPPSPIIQLKVRKLNFAPEVLTSKAIWPWPIYHNSPSLIINLPQ